jgi:hypothetical protein
MICPSVMLTRPNWLPIGLMKAVNGLMFCTTSPESGSLKTGMHSSLWQKRMLAHSVSRGSGVRMD